MGLLDGKSAIITGSARGIGRATAELFASEGAKVLINDLDGEVAEEASKEIEVYSHVRQTPFRLIDWSSRAKGPEQAAMGVVSLGFNLLYASYGGLGADDTIRAGLDYMWCCTMSGGQQNEQAGKVRDARRWSQRALEIAPGSTTARERAASLRTRAPAEANDLFVKATLAKKMQDPARAIRLYQQVIDLMLPGDDLREKAVREMEGLKR